MRGPAPRPTVTLGRAAETEALHAALLSNRGKIAVATGTGGIGKTALARHYVRTHAKRYDGILWVRAETVTTLAQDLALLPADGVTGLDGLPPEARARKLLDALPADKDWLIVYDNAPDAAALRDWWPNAARTRVLITTRSTHWPGDFGVIAPGVLATDAATDPGPQLLMREAGRRDDPEGARALAAELGGLPLALVAAGGLIGDTGGSFADYAARLAQVLAEVPKGDYPDSVIGAVKLSYDALGDDAQLVLDLFAWFASERLDAGLLMNVPASETLVHFRDDIPDDLFALCANPVRAEAALTALVRRSLLIKEGDSYSLHRMSAAAVRAVQAQAGRRDDVARPAAAVLAAAYPGGGERSPAFTQNWPACARLTPHVLALHRDWPLGEGDRLDSAAAVYLFNQGSIYLRQMAEVVPALVLAEAALDLTRARLPDSHRDVAVGWSTLGAAYQHAGRLEDAVTAQAAIVRLCEAHDHGAETLASAHNNHAMALRALGRARGDRALLEQARDANKAALPLYLEAFGEESDAVASSLSNLALDHAALGDVPAALDESTRALAIERRVLPPGDARLGFSLNNTGGCHLRLGQAGAARPLLAEALALWRAAYGRDDHPNVVDTAIWLVACHLVLARRDPAQEAEARRIADSFGLDWEKEQRKAAQLPGPVD